MSRDPRASDVRIRPRDVGERNAVRSSPFQRSSQPSVDDFERLKNRLITSEGELAVKVKETTQLKSEKRKLEEQVRDLTRHLEKVKEQLAKANAKAGSTAKEAQLSAEVRQLRLENDRLAGENKGCTNQIRSKDKELERLLILVEEATEVKLRNKELENQFSHMQQQLDSASQEIRTLQQVNRQREQDIDALTDEVEDLRADLMHTSDSLSISNATLKALEAKNQDMSTELSVMRDELTRTNVVAHRVAKTEHKAGLKHLEGTVTIAQHQEEVKYLQGDIVRLRDKLAQTERDLAVSRELQERYRQQAEGRRAPVSPHSSTDTTSSPTELLLVRSSSGNGFVESRMRATSTPTSATSSGSLRRSPAVPSSGPGSRTIR